MGSGYRPRLVRWATGRLPVQARSLFDTGDLVQETLMRAIQVLNGAEGRVGSRPTFAPRSWESGRWTAMGSHRARTTFRVSLKSCASMRRK